MLTPGRKQTIRRYSLIARVAAGWAALLGLVVSGSAQSADPTTHSYRLFVTNEGSGDIAVVDPSLRRTVARVPLGKRPRGIVASPNGESLYIALSGSPIGGPGVDESALPPADKNADGIAVFDIRTAKVIRVLRGVSDPEQLAIAPDGTRLYVASEDTGKLVVIDVRTGSVVAALDVGGEPEGVATSSDGRFVLATSEENNSIAVIDSRSSNVLGRIKVGQRPRNAAFLQGNKHAVVPGETDASVSLVDVEARQVLAKVTLDGELVRPMGVRVTNANQILVTTGRGGELVKLESNSLKILGRAKIAGRPWGLAISPDNKFAYTANGPANTLAMVDTRSMAVVATITVGDRPWGVVAVAHK